MRARCCVVGAAAVALGLAVGCGETKIVTEFDPGSRALVVSQQATLSVTGGEGSGVNSATFKLTDADGTVYDSGDKPLAISLAGAGGLSFTVPPAIAPGNATLSVESFRSSDYTYTGKVPIHRLIAIRDLGGGIWLPAITGDGTAEDKLLINAGKLGFGAGHVAMGFRGRLIASTAEAVQQVSLTWVDTAKPGANVKSHTFSTGSVVNDVAVTRQGVTLVATDSGTYYISRPDASLSSLNVSATPLATGDTLGLAVDRQGVRAVAVSKATSGRNKGSFVLALIDLVPTYPVALHQIVLPWTPVASAVPVAAVSPKGERILVADGNANKIALFVESKSTPVQKSFPSSESGCVALALTNDGRTLYSANATSKNLSVITVSDTDLTFGTPLDMSGGTGAPVDIATSEHGEVVVLLERDLVLITQTSVVPIKFDKLFSDKTNGEVGGSVAVQP